MQFVLDFNLICILIPLGIMGFCLGGMLAELYLEIKTGKTW